MRILDRHILKSMWSTFIGCILLFVFLYVIIDLFSNLDDILRQKVAFAVMARYYLTFLPVIFVQIAPFACLIATVYCLGNFNRDNELIAMRSAGISIMRIALPMIVFGLLVSMAVFWVNEKFVYQAQDKMKEVKAQFDTKKAKEKIAADSTLKNLSIYGMGNRLFFIVKFSPLDNTMEGITILEQDKKQNLTSKIIASRGTWDGALWRFYDVQTFNLDDKGKIIGEPRYSDEEIMDIPESPQDFINQRKVPEAMNIPQLQTYIWKLSQSGAKSIVRSLKVDLFIRYSFPLTSLVIIFLGIPFSMKIRKKVVGLSSIGISVMACFFYYVMNAVAIALGKSGVLPPMLAAWLANLSFFSYSLYLILQLS